MTILSNTVITNPVCIKFTETLKIDAKNSVKKSRFLSWTPENAQGHRFNALAVFKNITLCMPLCLHNRKKNYSAKLQIIEMFVNVKVIKLNFHKCHVNKKVSYRKQIARQHSCYKNWLDARGTLNSSIPYIPPASSGGLAPTLIIQNLVVDI